MHACIALQIFGLQRTDVGIAQDVQYPLPESDLRVCGELAVRFNVL